LACAHAEHGSDGGRVRPLLERSHRSQLRRCIEPFVPAIVKFDRFEWAIEKATDIGAMTIVPLAAERQPEKGLVVAVGKASG